LNPDPDPAFQVNPDPEPFRIQGFDDQKINKEIQQNTFLKSFLSKLQFTYPQASGQAIGDAFSHQKRTSSTSKN
jgi:hypothetical protein